MILHLKPVWRRKLNLARSVGEAGAPGLGGPGYAVLHGSPELAGEAPRRPPALPPARFAPPGLISMTAAPAVA